jgi:hypothetical protein
MRPNDSIRTRIARMHDLLASYHQAGGHMEEAGFLRLLKASFRTAKNESLRLEADRSEAPTVELFARFVV